MTNGRYGQLGSMRSPLVCYGGNSGDSMHAEPHARTSCHYIILWVNSVFSEVKLEGKDFQEVARLPWAHPRTGLLES